MWHLRHYQSPVIKSENIDYQVHFTDYQIQFLKSFFPYRKLKIFAASLNKPSTPFNKHSAEHPQLVQKQKQLSLHIFSMFFSVFIVGLINLLKISGLPSTGWKVNWPTSLPPQNTSMSRILAQVPLDNFLPTSLLFPSGSPRFLAKPASAKWPVFKTAQPQGEEPIPG